MSLVCDLITKKEKKLRSKYEDVHKFINGIEYKLCNICEGWLPSTEEHFYANKSNIVDGLHPYCKKCTSKKAHKWQKENPESFKESQRKQSKRKEILSKRKEYGKKYRASGRRKEWEEDNADLVKKYGENWRESKKHKIGNKEWAACREYFDNSCAYCGTTAEEHKEKYNKSLHREHVDNNGANDITNCVPACLACNVYKGKKDMLFWYMEECIYYEEDRLHKIYKWLQEDVFKI